jgi:hypothetical protein
MLDSRTLFSKDSRKFHFNRLMRKLLKISNNKLKSIDPYLNEFILLESRRYFQYRKNSIHLNKLPKYYTFIEIVCEDLERINIDRNKIIDIEITQSNFVVHN